MIEVEALGKNYREHIAIQDLSFSIEAGEVVGLLGPNGAGKSTTMRILTGFLPATSGHARVDGIDVFDHPIEVKRRVGYLPEIPPVYLDLTVGEYLRFVAALKGLPKATVDDAVRAAAERAGIADIQRRLIRNLSKGYRQRTGLAQALLGDPPVLIFDEPTAGLDPLQINQVRRLIDELGTEQNRTILMSTHIISEIRAVCQRIIMIARGRIVADAPIDALEAEHGASLEQVFAKLAEA